MLGGFLHFISSFIEKHPVFIALIGAIFGSIVIIIGVFFRQIKSIIASLSKLALRISSEWKSTKKFSMIVNVMTCSSF